MVVGSNEVDATSWFIWSTDVVSRSWVVFVSWSNLKCFDVVDGDVGRFVLERRGWVWIHILGVFFCRLIWWMCSTRFYAEGLWNDNGLHWEIFGLIFQGHRATSTEEVWDHAQEESFSFSEVDRTENMYLHHWIWDIEYIAREVRHIVLGFYGL